MHEGAMHRKKFKEIATFPHLKKPTFFVKAKQYSSTFPNFNILLKAAHFYSEALI